MELAAGLLLPFLGTTLAYLPREEQWQETVDYILSFMGQ